MKCRNTPQPLTICTTSNHVLSVAGTLSILTLAAIYAPSNGKYSKTIMSGSNSRQVTNGLNNMEFNPQAKIKPVRSKRYLSFIRSKPCIVCGSLLHAQAMHHSFGQGTMGGKPSDLWCLPGCHSCHHLEHLKGNEVPVEFRAIMCLKFINEFFSQGGKL